MNVRASKAIIISVDGEKMRIENIEIYFEIG